MSFLRGASVRGPFVGELRHLPLWRRGSVCLGKDRWDWQSATVGGVESSASNLTISLPDADVRALEVKAKAQGMSAEQYALQVLERDLAPDWLRKSWLSAEEVGLCHLSMDEIEAEIAAARQARRTNEPGHGA